MRRSYTFNIISRAILAIMMMASVSVWAEESTDVAQIGATKYATLQLAIDAVTESPKTITLLADITAEKEETVTVSVSQSISLEIGGHTIHSAITNSGALAFSDGTVSGNITNNENGTITISGGTFSGTITNNENATITITGGIFSTQPEAEWIAQGYVVKTNTGTTPNNYTVEPEVTVEVTLSGEASQTQKDAATALAGNTSVSETTGLGDNGSLDVSITGVTLSSDNTTVTSATFDVTPKDANGNTITVFSGTYTFRLPISAGIAVDKWVNLKHNSTPIPASQVVTDGINKYVTVTTTSFSPFSYDVLENAVAKIGEQLYETVADAITAAPDNTETTIELIADVTAASINIPVSKNVKLVGGEHSVSGTITSSGILTIVSGTYTNATENALKTEGEGTITINAGVFSKEPAASMIPQTSEVMVGESGTYVVAAESTAEAKIITTVGEVETTTLYQTIALAITAAAGTNPTTITLLKDVAAETITIPAVANITFELEEVTLTKSITNSGTLNISGGTIEGVVTNNNTLIITSGAISGNITNAESATMTISGGTFTGTITNNAEKAKLSINGGTFTNKPTGEYTCPDGKDLIINAEGKYEVKDIASAEAEIDGNKYLTIDKAITAAGETATTITLLKNPVADIITIPASANITLVINNVVSTFETLTKPISVEGKLAITSGKISESTTITVTNFNAKVNITSGVTHPAIVLSEALSTDNVLKSKTNDATPTVTSYWVEKKFDAKVDSSITDGTQKTAAETLTGNSAISEVTLAANQSLTITVTSVTLDGLSNVTKATFEVNLIGADGEAIKTEVSAVTFRLPIPANTPDNPWVNLWHGTTPITGTSTIQGSDNNRYISISSTSFSPFSYEIVADPIAQIGKTKYATVADAIEKATETETEIKLLRDVDSETTITVPADKNVKLTIGTHTVSGAITNNGTLTIAEHTGTISGNVSNTGTGVLSIAGGTISGAVSATDGTLSLSGGTISNSITTSGSAGLNISGGTIEKADADPALTIIVGGSGTNSISGTAIVSAAVTVNTVTLAITGGTFNSTITASGTDESNKGIINITGGIFTGTITETSPGDVAISGGTHTNLPSVALCANGYMPIKNADETYGMTNSWTVVDDTDLSINPHLENGGYKVATAKYERKSGMVAAGSSKTLYGTVCLPFEIKANPADVKALYKATSMDASAGELTIEKVSFDVSNTIDAGTPLIFELTEKATSMTLTSSVAAGVILVNTTAPSQNPVTTSGLENMLVGTYVNKEITGQSLTGSIYYINGDAFHQAKVKLTVPAFRAYLDTTPAPAGGARPSVLSIVKGEGEVTAITEAEAWETVSEVYDLNGRKQSGLQKGVNIMRRADGSSFRVIVK